MLYSTVHENLKTWGENYLEHLEISGIYLLKRLKGDSVSREMNLIQRIRLNPVLKSYILYCFWNFVIIKKHDFKYVFVKLIKKTLIYQRFAKKAKRTSIIKPFLMVCKPWSQVKQLLTKSDNNFHIWWTHWWPINSSNVWKSNQNFYKRINYQ